jgi:secondary thiamine-phosphate synthase enzyme
MKSYTEYLTLHLPSRTGFVNVTEQVAECVRKSGVREGLVLCSSMYITSSVFISVDEPGLHEDFQQWLETLAPFDNSGTRYQHQSRTGEENGDAHLKRQLMGRQVVLAVTKGQLDFGPFEHVFYGEFDGRRPKQVLVKIIGE